MGLINTVTAFASAGGGTDNVSDISDDGNLGLGDTGKNPTRTALTAAGSIEVIKTAVLDQSNAGDPSTTDAGDTITYTITVENTGNLTLSNLSLTDTMTRNDTNNTALSLDSGPTFASADLGSAEGALLPGETATYTATYTLVQADLDAGGVSNSVAATVSSPTGTGDITDVSDDGGNGPTNTGADPTSTSFAVSSAMEVVKTAVLDKSIAGATDAVDVGDTVNYTITVEYTGNQTINNLSLVDTLTRNDSGQTALMLDAGPTYVSADAGSAEGTLTPGETATYSGVYTLTQDDLNANGVTNTVTATASSPTGTNDVTDVSDDGDTGAGDTGADPTVMSPGLTPSMSLTNVATNLTKLYPSIYQATVRMTLTNSGSMSLTDTALKNDLGGWIGTSNVISVDQTTLVSAPTGVALNAGFDGMTDTDLLAPIASLDPAQQIVVDLMFTISTAEGFPETSDTAVGQASNLPSDVYAPADMDMTDEDDDGAVDSVEPMIDDRDGDGIVDARDYDPMGYFYCEEDGRIQQGGSITVTGPAGSNSNVGQLNGITIAKDGSDGMYQWFVNAPGTYTMFLNYPTSGVPSTTRGIAAASVDVTSLSGNPVVLGGTEIGATGILSDFSAEGNPFYLTFDIEAGDPDVMANNIPMALCSVGEVALSVEQNGREKDQSAADNAVFIVTLPRISANDVVIGYTIGGTATSGADYIAPTGTVTIPAGETLAFITAEVINDTVKEDEETIVLTMTSIVGDANISLPSELDDRTASASIFDSLIDQIQDEVVDILVDDLTNTITVQSQQIAGYSRDAAVRLRAGPSPDDFRCVSDSEFTPNAELDLANGTGTISGVSSSETFDCVRDERHLIDTRFTVTRNENGDIAHTVTGSYRIERWEDDDKIRGRFYQAYANTPAPNSDGNRVSGYGLAAGVYGATRIGEGDLIADHYLGLGFGYHTFDLSFGMIDPILAKGRYSYLAGYAGVAVSGEIETDGEPVLIRAGTDLALASPSAAQLTATQSGVTENGLIDLPSVGTARMFAELGFTGAFVTDDQSREYSWAAYPRGFCDVIYDGDLSRDCGYGIDLELSGADRNGDREWGIGIEAEHVGDVTRASAALRFTRHILDDKGTTETQISTSTSGVPTISQTIEIQY